MKEFFFTEVVKGTPAPSSVSKFMEAMKSFEGRLKVTVEKKRNNRSLNQNAYYWGCVVQFYVQGIAEMWGEKIGSEQAHEDLKRECNWIEKVKEETGEVRRFVLSTTELTTTEFEEYLERCRRFLHEYFGITVPLPNEQADFHFELDLKEKA